MSCSYYWTDHKKHKVRCEYLSRDPERLKTHVDEHKYMKHMSFRCSLCSYGMNTGVYLETHVSQCHEDWLNSLSEEEYALYKPKLVLNHENKEQKVYACNFVLEHDKRRYGCDFTSLDMKTMNHHLECHENKLDRGYQCSLCAYFTSLEDECVEHCKNSHTTMIKKKIIRTLPKPVPVGINQIKKPPSMFSNSDQTKTDKINIINKLYHDNSTQTELEIPSCLYLQEQFYHSYTSSQSKRDPGWTSKYDGIFDN